MNDRSAFWSEAFAIQGSVTPRVMPRVLCIGAFATAVWAIWWYGKINATVAIAPYEFAGAVLALLLVLRTNSGYDRWWEARKLWGGIVNQTRNFAIMADAYGSRHALWREQVIRWAAAFAHICRRSLRGERDLPEIQNLLGADAAREIAAAGHMPNYISRKLARLLRQAVEEGTIDRFEFLQMDRERALLIDHLGACERIMKTPLPLAYSIKIRRFIVLFLTLLPFALLERIGALTPLFTMLVAYPLLSLDLIGHELQNPFSQARISHLPLDDICQTIETNLMEIASDTSANETYRPQRCETLTCFPDPLVEHSIPERMIL